MIYLNEQDIEKIGINWNMCTDVIREAVVCHSKSETVQPIKPYLRFKNLKNRIIAMPAYVGGKFDIAGIKWIASFPNNIQKNIPRASSVLILNDSNTGQIESIINTGLLSIIRTTSVSALVIKYFLEARKKDDLTIGIIGLGPIGLYHLKMCQELYGDKISKIILYDIKGTQKETLGGVSQEKIFIAENWTEAYSESDVVITCTVSEDRYIDLKPKPGSLLLNVSLRDYRPEIFKFVKDSIIVDEWGEVCRENTDIEIFHKEKGLLEEQVRSIDDIVVHNIIDSYPVDMPVMFNPMGMAIFDIAIAKYYLDIAKDKKVGHSLS